MARKKETITLSIPPGTKEQLEAIADRLGIHWGKSPSISGLLVAIAQQQLEVLQPSQVTSLTSEQVRALRQATKVLVDTGYLEEAQSVITLLISQGDLEAPLRQSLLEQLKQHLENWRTAIDRQITERQPFRLSYRNSQAQDLEYTVRYAEVCFYEKRFYLQIWCEETHDSQDIPELVHNRCLRFDRIQSIEPIPGEWRGQLDSVKVYLRFRGWLVKAYEPKPEDIENEVMGNVRQVVRRVSNPFWLIREVLRYGEDCVVVSPDSVRDRIKQKLIELCRKYDLNLED